MRKVAFVLFGVLIVGLVLVQQAFRLPSPLALVTAGKQKIIEHYREHNKDSLPSKSIGSVSNGKLEHGRIVPFYGANFQYFDESSYLANRAFTHQKVLNTILEGYESLQQFYPNRKFYLMELSHQHGGRLFPHRTHQNGMSADFMMPKLKNGKSYTALDSIGKQHYFLSFDNQGRYEDDSMVKIDFNTIAHHILLLEQAARKNGLKIKKVIIKTEYKPYLFATKYGKQLKDSGIYIVQSLTPMINTLHDEHFHIDFTPSTVY